VATANILNYELEAPLEAVDLYNQALDEIRRSAEFRAHPAHPVRTADWRSLARAYRRMISDWGQSFARQAALAAWPVARAGRPVLAQSARHAAATAAYEVCVSLAPEDANTTKLWQNLRGPGPAMFRQAVKTREHLLRMSSNADEAAKHVEPWPTCTVAKKTRPRFLRVRGPERPDEGRRARARLL